MLINLHLIKIKPNIHLFIKLYKKPISFKFPSLFIHEKEMEHVSSSKFIGIMLDEHLTSKNHVIIIENKVLENLETWNFFTKQRGS